MRLLLLLPLRHSASDLAANQLTEDYFDEVSRQFNALRQASQLLTTTHDPLPQLSRQLAEQEPAVILFDSMCAWGYVEHPIGALPEITTASRMAELYVPK